MIWIFLKLQSGPDHFFRLCNHPSRISTTSAILVRQSSICEEISEMYFFTCIAKIIEAYYSDIPSCYSEQEVF